MFENLNQNTQSGQSAGSTRPPAPMAEDMFASVDPKPKPPVFEKKSAVLDELNQPLEDGNHHSLQKAFFLLMIVLLLILLGAGGVWAYRYFSQKIVPSAEDQGAEPESGENTGDEAAITDDNTQNIADEAGNPAAGQGQNDDNGADSAFQTGGGADNAAADDAAGQEAASQISTTTGQAADEPADDPILDSDNDGLTDAEEWELGTDVNSVDTDNDGLFDREEAKVYKTDPRNPDSDGDTYADGAEVKGGYNPLGPGRLYGVE